MSWKHPPREPPLDFVGSGPARVKRPVHTISSVTFELALSETGHQVIPAKVMRALGTDYGFQFTALSAEQRNQIQSALRKSPQLSRPQSGIIWS